MGTQRYAQKAASKKATAPIQPKAEPKAQKANETGMPDTLKAGVEKLSGFSMDDVRVHYNSAQPAQLQAHAFAQGSNIHLAPGQEKHLPHEAWHVVQQKQGRVQATKQLKGIALNDNSALEKEADQMGAQAAQYSGGAGNQQPLQARKSGNVVQRAIGFEFETGWLIQKDLTESAHDDVEVPEVLQSLKKKEKVGTSTYSGFKLEADEALGGLSEIEFVIDPPLPENASALETLQGIMNMVEHVGMQLLAHSDKNRFTLGEATGQSMDHFFVVTPNDSTLSAGPQVTSGIDLAKIPTLFSHKNAGQMAPESLKSSLGEIEETAREISTTHEGNKLSPQLLGLLTLITNYLRAGRGRMGEPSMEPFKDDPSTKYRMALSYPKQIADLLLSRTKFSKLFELLPKEEQLYYQTNPQKWLDLVINSAGGYKLYDPLKPVIERRIRSDESGVSTDVEDAGPRRVEWILGIPFGADRISEMTGAESMGELGNKTEGVSGGGRVEAGIFEFRGAQRTKIPLSEWSNFAMSFMRYVLTLHDQSLPIPIPQKKNKK